MLNNFCTMLVFLEMSLSTWSHHSKLQFLMSMIISMISVWFSWWIFICVSDIVKFFLWNTMALITHSSHWESDTGARATTCLLPKVVFCWQRWQNSQTLVWFFRLWDYKGASFRESSWELNGQWTSFLQHGHVNGPSQSHARGNTDENITLCWPIEKWSLTNSWYIPCTHMSHSCIVSGRSWQCWPWWYGSSEGSSWHTGIDLQARINWLEIVAASRMKLSMG